MPLDEKALRSLVTLLEEEDPASLALVRSKILGVGAAIIPYLDELRPAATPEMAVRLESVAGELRFQDLRRDFVRLSLAKAPDLEEGSLLISRFGFADVDSKVYAAWLDKVAAKIAADMPPDAGIGESVRRLTNHVFQSLGFAGNESRYYDPDNSYLSRVIDTRRGIPVTLTVLVLLLARRLRLPLYGVGTPGHFLAGFKEGGSSLFVDCFRSGQLMTLPEVKRMLVRNGYDWRPELGKPVGSRDILARMLRNLISIYQKTGASDRAERLSTLVEIVLTGRDAGTA
ncbi:MAG: transglutaminase-like domain-containing protein [Elusimicrobiota bacterium]|nr:MAG: transglutaminase-like domain-containing protein [Elusimicrobiota bacterium]